MKLRHLVDGSGEFTLVAKPPGQCERLLQMRPRGSKIPLAETRGAQGLEHPCDPALIPTLSSDRQAFLKIATGLRVATHEAAELACIRKPATPGQVSLLRPAAHECLKCYSIPQSQKAAVNP